MNSVHKINWQGIVRMLQSMKFSDLHKFYSVSGGWCYLTDRFGIRHEIMIGNTISDFRKIANEVRETNGYNRIFKQRERANRFRNTPPPSK